MTNNIRNKKGELVYTKKKVYPKEDNIYYKRAIIIRKLGYQDYKKYLKSDLWIGIRERVYEKFGKICFRCKKTENLQIHHHKYTVENLSGVDLEYLYVVCGSCHHRAEFTNAGKKRFKPLALEKSKPKPQKLKKEKKISKSEELMIKDGEIREQHILARDAKLKSQLEEIGDFEEIERRGLYVWKQHEFEFNYE